MPSDIRLSRAVQETLRCPICKSRLERAGEGLKCAGAACGAEFPVVNGAPILIDEQTSVFSVSDYLPRPDAPNASTGATALAPPPRRSVKNAVKQALVRMTPSISANVRGSRNYDRFAERLLAFAPSPRLLVVGGCILGQGMEALANNPAIELVESDVIFGPRTALICDGHQLPFEDASFDGVIIQAVLEHVVDPVRCVEEIHRVLRPGGLVYAETPFMQQVHGGAYDFTRFTHLGHRRLFRKFDELESGAMCGPGMALAWAWQYFLTSFTASGTARLFIRLFAGLTSFFLKYFDPYLINAPGALDAASGYYFMGRKGDTVLSDRELIKLYRGAL